MTVYVGPTNWWWISSPTASINCKVKALVNTCGGPGGVLNDGSIVGCSSNGLAFIIAPSTTSYFGAWAGGQYNSTSVGNKCCLSEWTSMCNLLISRGFNPSDWFVPSQSQLATIYQNISKLSAANFSNDYWSSTEAGSTIASGFGMSSGVNFNINKTNSASARAFRCVTY